MSALGSKGAIATAELAHEIRNVLTIIDGAALVLRRFLPEGTDGRALVEEILNASGRAAVAAKRVMEIAREQTERQ